MTCPEAMPDPEDCGRLSSIGRYYYTPLFVKGTVMPEYQIRQNHTPAAIYLLHRKPYASSL